VINGQPEDPSLPWRKILDEKLEINCRFRKTPASSWLLVVKYYSYSNSRLRKARSPKSIWLQIRHVLASST